MMNFFSNVVEGTLLPSSSYNAGQVILPDSFTDPPWIKSHLGQIGIHQQPIVYRHEYNISFLGAEKLHPFDAFKWGNIFQFLKQSGMVNENSIFSPQEALYSDLQQVHTDAYLNSLKAVDGLLQWSFNVAKIVEISLVSLVPNSMLQNGMLKSMRYQVGGSMLAGKFALERGWAINLGGGFHHSHRNGGGGFCVYADITLLIRTLFTHFADQVTKAMILDLDAHQGNGYARDFMRDQRVYIVDVYNKAIYPADFDAKRAIKMSVELRYGVSDSEYLNRSEAALRSALQEFHPDILVYNAGTDVLKGDPLGKMAITAKGIIQRDEMVFSIAKEYNVPIVMLTSGGYQESTARIIADSIINLRIKGLIPHNALWCKTLASGDVTTTRASSNAGPSSVTPAHSVHRTHGAPSLVEYAMEESPDIAPNSELRTDIPPSNSELRTDIPPSNSELRTDIPPSNSEFTRSFTTSTRYATDKPSCTPSSAESLSNASTHLVRNLPRSSVVPENIVEELPYAPFYSSGLPTDISPID